MAFPPQAPNAAGSRRALELAAWARERAPQLDEEGRAWTMSDQYCHEWLEAVVPFPRWARVPQLKAALRAELSSIQTAAAK